MPDLTIQTARWCATNDHAIAHIGEYEQTFNGHNPGPYSRNWACTCRGYQFRKTCKHIVAAERMRCCYGWEAAAGSPIEMGEMCPACGEKTEVVSYAT
jgi:hypothetical protein